MEYDITIQKQNNSYVQLHCDESMNHKIYCLFSAFQPGYRFNPRYKLKLWDGKIHCYSPITQLLPIGLVDNLLNWCKKNNYTYKLFGLDDFKDTISYADMKNEVNSQITKFDARDYQLSAIYQALTNKRGVLLSCTGSGKSLMIYGILKYLINRKNKRHLLLIVPSVSLVEQMYSDFIDYGWKNIENDVEKLYSGMDPTYKTPVLISTWQSLENQDKDFFTDFQGVIVDECVDGDTLIDTINGKEPIKNIKIGDYVKSYNIKTNQIEYCKVLEVFKNHISSKNSDMLEIELVDGKKIKLTANHPVFTTNRGWVRAGDLNENDDLKIINNINETSEDVS